VRYNRNLDRRGFLSALTGGAAAMAATACVRGARSGANRPNIVLCMADDQGWNEVGYYGHPFLKTPVLDEMAGAGLRFDRFYSGAPVCSPTRGSVMTGRHPNRFGCFTWNYSIRPEEITIAEILKQAGYATGHFGKWHLGPVKRDSLTNPGANGFDHWLSHDNFFELDPPLVRDGGSPQTYPGESSEIVVEAAIDFIDRTRRGNRPFFVVVWFGSPHGPYRGIDRDLAVYDNVENEQLKHRFAEITAMDRALGRLRDHLRGQGLADNTLLWYCSDNGIPKQVRAHTELRGNKGTVYEGGLRVPGIIEWPAVIDRPMVTDVPCVTSDILPTVCDLLSVPLPERPIDGISLVPLIKGRMQSRPRPICFWHYDRKREEAAGNEPWLDPVSQQGTTPTAKRDSIQFQNFRHPVARTEDFGGSAAITDNRYKLVESKDGAIELFDIMADTNETRNIADEKPGVVAKLKKQLRSWQMSVEESLTGADYTVPDRGTTAVRPAVDYHLEIRSRIRAVDH